MQHVKSHLMCTINTIHIYQQKKHWYGGVLLIIKQVNFENHIQAIDFKSKMFIVKKDLENGFLKKTH